MSGAAFRSPLACGHSKSTTGVILLTLPWGLYAAAQAVAGSIDTLSDWTDGSIDSFGELSGNNPGGTTFGQTFTIHDGDVVCQNLTFLVRGYYPVSAPQPCTFETFIMAWNGSRPTGPVLFQSSPLVTTMDFPNWQTFSLPLNQLVLNKNRAYVAFFTANDFLDGLRSDAAMGSVGNLYPDGGVVFHYSGFSFSDLLAQDWWTGWEGAYDFAFKLDYQVIPEPGATMLFGLGSLLALAHQYRRFQPSLLRR